ncbi:MAG TPA: leucyl aminopeptidase [Gemmatimonadota bacterium]|nr:leucyl aminopeptidase [Gemmatimonadota bacterium]
MIEPRVQKGDVTTVRTKALIVNLYEGVKTPKGATGAIDAALDGQIKRLIRDGEITGKLEEVTIVHTAGRIPAARVLVVGLGKKEKCDLEAVRRAAGAAARRLLRHGITRFHTILHGGGDPDATGFGPAELAQALAEGTLLAAYSFDRYKTVEPGEEPGEPRKREKRNLEALTVVERDADLVAGIRAGLARGARTAEAVNYTRDIGNLPPNELTPAALAERAVALAEEHGLKVDVFDRARLEKAGMGGILGVGQGSVNEPRMIVLRYRGGKKGAKPVAVVGKAITFDTGGISIKPSLNMEEMKFDKMGGCAVLGILNAVARLELPINVLGVIPAAENMPGGGAYRPGDILTSYSGKTIEIINTDAEGRLVLADALAWTSEQEPRAIVDLATLTGACVVALGHHATGAFGDEEMVARMVEIGARTGDRAWPLPLYEEFGDEMKSKVADIKNSSGRWGGASTAAAFLQFFVGEDIPWVHLDIAGTAWVTEEKGYSAVGATGAGVRLVTEWLATSAED